MPCCLTAGTSCSRLEIRRDALKIGARYNREDFDVSSQTKPFGGFQSENATACIQMIHVIACTGFGELDTRKLRALRPFLLVFGRVNTSILSTQRPIDV